MVVLSVVFIPRFYRLRVYTAYEYLESRFDLKTRQLTAFLFLLQRGLSAGITIYAPAIMLSKVLGWSLNLTNVAIGGLVILYTVAGGTRAVSQTQKHQMVVMLGGMVVAFVVIVYRLPPDLSFGNAVHVAGALGKMNVVDMSLDPGNRYTLWSGLTGGFFLAMSYFGTDQSQVQRYLSGRSVTESRLGLLFNGLLKIPMQALILFVGRDGVRLQPVQRAAACSSTRASSARLRATPHAAELRALEAAHHAAFDAQCAPNWASLRSALDARPRATPRRSTPPERRVRRRGRRRRRRARAVKALIGSARCRGRDQGRRLRLPVVRDGEPAARADRPAAGGDPVRRDVVDRQRAVRAGAVHAGRLLSAQLPAPAPDRRPLRARWPSCSPAGWGVLAVVFAASASLVDNLIQAVNILGSLFYGTILGHLPGRLLHPPRAAAPPCSSPRWSPRWSSSPCGWGPTSASCGST